VTLSRFPASHFLTEVTRPSPTLCRVRPSGSAPPLVSTETTTPKIRVLWSHKPTENGVTPNRFLAWKYLTRVLWVPLRESRCRALHPVSVPRPAGTQIFLASRGLWSHKLVESGVALKRQPKLSISVRAEAFRCRVRRRVSAPPPAPTKMTMGLRVLSLHKPTGFGKLPYRYLTLKLKTLATMPCRAQCRVRRRVSAPPPAPTKMTMGFRVLSLHKPTGFGKLPYPYPTLKLKTLATMPWRARCRVRCLVSAQPPASINPAL